MLAGTMALSLLFCLHLLLLEYLRILVMGVALTCVYATFPRSFARHFACVALLAAVYAYTYVIVDPALNGTSLVLGEEVSALNPYRLITLGLLSAAALIVLQPYIMMQRPWVELRYSITGVDVRVLLILAGIMGVYTALDILRAWQTGTSGIQAMLRGTKVVDLYLAYLLVRLIADHSVSARRQTNILVYAFLAFAGFAVLIGGVRATAAYRASRFPARIDDFSGVQRRGAMAGVRENLLRVFSLSSRETRLVFEAGYYAGQADWGAAGARLSQAGVFPRPGLDEARLGVELATGAYNAAIASLESIPLAYELSSFTRDRLDEIELPLQEPGADPRLFYLAGLLALHEDEPGRMRNLLDEFLAVYPHHANALYFRYHNDLGRLISIPPATMSVRGWLQPADPRKPVAEHGEYVTLVFNQQLRGYLWLPKGTYEVTMWARDDGTRVNAEERAQFDPACKTRVWVGRDLAAFSVYSTNRQFQAYTMRAKVTTTPVRVAVEFLNDVFDDEHQWDRNLSVSYFSFRRVDLP